MSNNVDISHKYIACGWIVRYNDVRYCTIFRERKNDATIDTT
ncbi:hypothetical protein [Metabacillus niabensis]|nr:hypothetical protein [Metabacillus niabensis]